MDSSTARMTPKPGDVQQFSDWGTDCCLELALGNARPAPTHPAPCPGSCQSTARIGGVDGLFFGLGIIGCLKTEQAGSAIL